MLAWKNMSFWCDWSHRSRGEWPRWCVSRTEAWGGCHWSQEVEGDESTKETEAWIQAVKEKLDLRFCAGLGHSPQPALSFHLAMPLLKASVLTEHLLHYRIDFSSVPWKGQVIFQGLYEVSFSLCPVFHSSLIYPWGSYHLTRLAPKLYLQF